MYHALADAVLIEQVGGPDRPIPQPKPQAARGATIDNATTETSALAGAAAGVQSNLYDRLTSAVNERG
jgi:syntaxin-binding protein 5